MTDQERALLLTVGRVLRARILETRISKNDDDDLFALQDALAPFDPTPGHGGNFESRADADNAREIEP